MIKNLLYVTLFLFALLLASVSVAEATEITLDTEHHHLGDEFKEELNPDYPEGLVYTVNFTLDPSVNIKNAELSLTGKSVLPEQSNEFLDKVYLNDMEIGNLNDYIPAEILDYVAVNITIPVHPSFFNSGDNVIKISAGSNVNSSNHNDFEFYDLSLHISEIEPVTLEPPLKVAWTYKLPWKFECEKPAVKIIAADGVLYLCEKYEQGIIAIDAETGKQLWSKESNADLEYRNGILFAVCPSKIDALDARTGDLLWSREFPDIWWENPLIFGNTLFVSTPYEMRVAAIDTENGNLKWEHELGNSMSNLVANENVTVIGYYSGVIALDTKTGEEVWRYSNLSEYSYSPWLYKDMVYIEDLGEIIALSAKSGEEVWKIIIDDWAGIAKIKNDRIIVNSNNTVLLNASNGEVLEEIPYSQPPASSPVITDKYVYSTDQYNIKIFNSSTGEPLWSSSRIKGASVSDPTLYKNKLYLVSTEGILYAFDHGEGGLLFTEGLENSATFYFPQVAIAGMILLLAIIIRQSKNRALFFGLWLIALVEVLLLSLKVIDPYICEWEILGILAFLTFWSLPVILLIGIIFLMYHGIWKRKK